MTTGEEVSLLQTIATKLEQNKSEASSQFQERNRNCLKIGKKPELLNICKLDKHFTLVAKAVLCAHTAVF